MTVGVVLLAAGFSRRFGDDKRQQMISPGVSLLEHAVARALASGLPLRVSLREDDHALAAILRQRGVEVLSCSRAAEGMGATLAESVAALPPTWEAVLVALADMPDVQVDTYRALAREASPAHILVPEHAGQAGHPVAFGARFYRELRELAGDAGGRGVMASNSAAVRRLPVSDAGILRDIDTPQALAQHRRGCR